MREAVEPRALLVVGTQDVPRRVLGVRRLEHQIAGTGILEPFAARGQVHRAKFPLAHRILDARLEAAFLLLVARLPARS